MLSGSVETHELTFSNEDSLIWPSQLSSSLSSRTTSHINGLFIGVCSMQLTANSRHFFTCWYHISGICFDDLLHLCLHLRSTYHLDQGNLWLPGTEISNPNCAYMLEMKSTIPFNSCENISIRFKIMYITVFFLFLKQCPIWYDTWFGTQSKIFRNIR
jgi:hypothetical protein